MFKHRRTQKYNGNGQKHAQKHHYEKTKVKLCDTLNQRFIYKDA